MKKIWNNWLKESIILYCVIYTATTILNSVLYLSQNIYEDPSGNWHELDRAMIMLIGIFAFEFSSKLPVKNIIFKAILGYVPTILLAFCYVWMVGFREPLAESAYRDIAFNFTGLYLIVFIIAIIRDLRQKKNR